MLPEADVAAIRAFCAERMPPPEVEGVRLAIIEDGRAVTLVERRAPWRDDPDLEWTTTLVARWRYVAKDALWTLYWPDRDGRWRRYEDVAPTADISVLLDEVDDDPTGIFWG